MLNLKKIKWRLVIAGIALIGSCLYYVNLLFNLPENSITKGMAIAFFTVVLPNFFPIFIGMLAYAYITSYLNKSKQVITVQTHYGMNSNCNLTTASEPKITIHDFDEQQKSELFELLKQQLTNTTSADLITEIKAQAATAFQADTFLEDITNFYQFSQGRLYKEMDNLGRRGNSNLALGVIITVMGLYVLGDFLLSSGEPPQELWSFLVHYLPRLTFVIFIELFAYFFLRLYRAGLEEIKYFQNELTNLESKHIALRAAFKQNDATTINAVIITLAATERNRILNKNQTTIELEAARIEKHSTVELNKLLTNLVSSFAPKKSE